MKKGINKEYDEVRKQLYELRYKIQLLRMDLNKKQELEQLEKEANSYLESMKTIEFSKMEK